MRAALLAVALLVPAAALAADGDYPPPSHPGAATERPPGPYETRRVCARRGCFQTVAAAVRAARAGDRIVVAAGRYRESVRIRGAAKRFVRLAGDGAVLDRLAIVAATGVSVRGLATRAGIVVRGARDFTLRDVSTRGGRYGIRVVRSEGGTIARTSVAGASEAGVSIERTPAQTRPRRTMLRRVTVSSSPVGLRLVAARWVTATGLAARDVARGVEADAATADVCVPGSPCG